MKITIEVLLLAIVIPCSSVSFGADPNDPRWIRSSPLINPRATYLRTCSDNPFHAAILNLDNYGIFINDWIVIRRKGDYDAGGGWVNIRDMVGVFSSSNRLLADELSRQHRVPDAVPIPLYGQSIYTLRTNAKCSENAGDEPENMETDIPEDFDISDAALVKVPAQYYFISPSDSRFVDNSDPDQDYHVEFSDEVKWCSQSDTCNTCWDDDNNWDVKAVPIPEVGITFDSSGVTEVTNADSIIKYLRIVVGKVYFQDDTDLKTTVCETSKDSFVVGGAMASVYGAMASFSGGKLRTCRIMIGFGGILNLDSGAIVNSDSLIHLNGGIVWVDDNSLLTASIMQVGDPDLQGGLSIHDKGRVEITGGMIIKSYGLGFSTVTVGDLGSKLSAGGHILVGSKAILRVKNDGVIEARLGISVGEHGLMTGCNLGRIVGNVTNTGGRLEGGCSIGKLIIDGDYIQETEGTLTVEISGKIKEEEYDVLEVTGNVTLDGTVQLDFTYGFAPKKGDVFEFLKIGGTANGSFSDVSINGLQDGFQYDISLEGGVAKLTALNNAVPKSTVSPIIHLLLRDTAASK